MEKFFKMPKALFTSQYSNLSSDAKLLYMLIADRFQLSVANGWCDSTGKTYCYFKREDMMNMLGLSAVSVRKLMKQLQEHDLIEEKRQGFGKPNRIYIISNNDSIEKEDKQQETSERGASEYRKDNNHLSGVTECDSQDSKKMSSNKTDKNYIETNKTEPDPDQIFDPNRSKYVYQASAADWQQIFRMKLVGPFQDTEDESMADSIVELMSEIMVSNKTELKIHGDMIPIEMIQSRFSKLTAEHVRYVINSIRISAVRKIYNLKSYLLTCLYESVTTMQTYYINAVNCAFESGEWSRALGHL